MNKFTMAALKFLSDNAHSVMEGASGADMIGVNRATLRSRIMKGQALAMRDSEGRERDRIEFTPFHLVHNMIHDAAARYNAVPSDEFALDQTQAVFADLEKGRFRDDLMVRIVLREGRRLVHTFHGGDEVEQFTGEPCVLIPIGTMVVRFATTMAMKHNTAAMRDMMAN